MSNNRIYNPLSILATIGFAVSGLFFWRIKNNIKQVEEQVKNIDNCSECSSVSEDVVNAELKDRLDTYENRVTLLEEKLSSMASHEKRILNLAERVSNMQDHGQRIYQVEHGNKVNNDSVQNIDKRISDVEREVRSTKNKTEDNNQRLSKIEIEKPVYTFFPGPSNGSHTGPAGDINDILGKVQDT